MDQLFIFSGKLISCMITTIVYFRFMDDRYTRIYQSKTVYFILKALCCFLNFVVYDTFDMAAANFTYWIIIAIVLSVYFYENDRLKRGKYYLINVAMIFVYGICESLGAILVNTGISILAINQKQPVIDFIYTISGSTTAILLYFIVLKRLFTDEKISKISARQFTAYTLLTISGLINIGGILIFLKNRMNGADAVFLLLDAVFVIFINLYLLYLLDTMEENRNLKYKLALYERQSQSNYEYYIRQMESKKEVLSVLHDARKHIRVLEELKQNNLSEEIKRYAEAFEKTVEPLLVNHYCENAVLNIILNDKMDYCKKNYINFETKIDSIKIDFMASVDITTVFGNLLDNAVEACMKAENRIITFQMHSFNSFICAKLSNTYSGNIRWEKGKPRSQKGERHGIGLENVENVLKKYNGGIQFREENGNFVTEIMFSKP